MKILLATGIYPPEIGGPATYVLHLSQELVRLGHQVTILTYGNESCIEEREDGAYLLVVPRAGGVLARYRRYAKLLTEHATSMDVVYVFSTMSVGIPLRMARIKGPIKVLRLGGDVLWERYTDHGGKRGIRAFYQFFRGMRLLMRKLLTPFDAIVFSTNFQARLSEYLFRGLPKHTVIENALPEDAQPVLHVRNEQLKLLYFGRYVRFKNLLSLLRAVIRVPYVHLTFVGEGPDEERLREFTKTHSLEARVTFLPSAHGEEKKKIFLEHDLLVMPSITEISPNSAIEARSTGLPVLLTEETGLSAALTEGMILKPLRTSHDITRALLEAERSYDEWAQIAAKPLEQHRSWPQIAEETVAFFEQLQTTLPPRV
jgi:glycosyltransferase involved in cell wall biosynthesis